MNVKDFSLYMILRYLPPSLSYLSIFLSLSFYLFLSLSISLSLSLYLSLSLSLVFTKLLNSVPVLSVSKDAMLTLHRDIFYTKTCGVSNR